MELNKRYGWCKFIVVVPIGRDPRGREEVVRHDRRALPADLRHQAAIVHLQLVAAARAGAVQVGRRRAGDDHQHPGVQRHRQGQPPHLRRAGRLPVPPAHRRHQREPADRHHRRAAEDRGDAEPQVTGGAVAVQRPHGAALLGDPQGRAHQGPPPRRARCLQPEAGQEDRRARHHREGPGRHHSLPVPRRDRDRQGREAPGPRRDRGADQGRAIKRQVKRLESGHQPARHLRRHRGLQGPVHHRHRRQPRRDRAEQRRRRQSPVSSPTGRDRGSQAAHPDPRGHPRAPRQGA